MTEIVTPQVWAPLHTKGHVSCPACEQSREMLLRKLAPQMLLALAIDTFIDQQTIKVANPNIRYVSERTLLDYRQYGNTLLKFYGEVEMQQIHVGTYQQYCEARAVGPASGFPFKKPAGANKIIQETGFLTQLLKKSGCWTQEWEENYRPLQRPIADVPLALQPEQQKLWLEVSSSQPEWSLVYYYSVLAFATATNHQETRKLKIRDINLFNEYIEIRAASAKNKYRVRTVPIDQESGAIFAIERLLERAKTCGADSPHHYLFPFRRSGNEFVDVYDPLKPMSESGLKKRWHEVRDEVGKQLEEDLSWFNPKDCRHTALTRWAESGMPIHVMLSLAGHVSQKMQEHYVHISEAAKRKSLKKASAQFMRHTVVQKERESASA